MSVLTAWCLDKSNVSSFASAALSLRKEKSMSVCSGWMPHRLMICGISETRDRMASTPSSPRELLSRLSVGEGKVSRGEVSRGADTKANTFGGGGALERGNGAPLEPLAQLGDALRGVGAASLPVDAAELVASETVSEG